MHGRLTRERIGLLFGPLAFLSIYFLNPFGMPPEAAAVLAGTLWIAIWWVSEAVPIAVAALLPVVLFPVTDVVSIAEATAPYADPIVFLLLGGFLLALSIERWELHERLALQVIRTVGFSSRRLVLGFMVATGGLSMWISNTATAMMMVPIGGAVILKFAALSDSPAERGMELPQEPVEQIVFDADRDPDTLPKTNFGLALMLGIAYGASIGGATTLIGSPPNAIFAGVAESSLGITVGFLDWMLFTAPVSATFMLLAWLFLVYTLPPETETIEGGGEVIERSLDELGRMSRGERRTLLVFGLVVVGWISRPFLIEPIAPAVSDTVIAIVGGILLFVVPADRTDGTFLLDWSSTRRLPWGVLVLIGAGFSIAHAFQASGLDRWIADLIGALPEMSFLLVLVTVAVVVVFLTEVNSNTATASVFVPLMIGISYALGVPSISLMAITALVASYAFMLPVATPPNAIVFGSGYMTVPEMARVGFWLNLFGVVLATAATYLWLPFVLG
ncbi:Na+/H+ antiporter NhaD or related arsenite permease [Halalkaliarchaeum sp. AArc-CO]|uniref:SLC13 family permease n=1 Tax=Halalkaliarchaeum sp. AArc-CO TaxID=2866381 RepID=UPI00217DEB5E|nr:DASS family sodium-coupled anion symporter [Halalkaliarchaeum sp. AArc-CO]UWG49940.1 Na+/H+ antiporter NhaD or related arsenite permease [Halalkaliarchaeum sp. AArc-CO]